jgi:hypothetical protein
MQHAAALTFGTDGNAAPHLLSGWSTPEPGFTWALGPESTLRIPLLPGSGDLLLDITLRPFMIPPHRMAQRVGLLANGVPIGIERVQDDSALGFRIPAALAAGHPTIDITLQCPDALSPAQGGAGTDTRNLGVQLRDMVLIWADPAPAFAPRHRPALPLTDATPSDQLTTLVRYASSLPPAELMMQFESLGMNCEFGLLQRHYGANPHSLLRFVGIEIQDLLLGLDKSFEDIDNPAQLRAYTDGSDSQRWISFSAMYNLHRHSYQAVAEMDEAAFLAAERRKLARERERFQEVLATGERLFVYQRNEFLQPAHVMPILNMLRSHGPNALLFVTPNYGAPSGSVDLLAPDLYRGNIDRLAPQANAIDSNVPAWTSICANAYRLWRETGHGA